MTLPKLKKIYFVKKKELDKDKLIRKYFDELKDEVILFKDKNKEIKIFSSICPHFGGEIYYDKTDDNLKCNWHGWKFSGNTGKCLSHPIKGKLNPYTFQINPDNLKEYNYSIEGEDVYLYYG